MVIETVFRSKSRFRVSSRSTSAPTRDPPRSRQGRFASGNNNGERAASGGARRVGCHEKSRAGDERLRRVRGPTGARRGRRPGAHFSRAAARRPSRSPPCRRFERLGFQKTTREAHLVGGASCLPRDSRRTCSSDTVCCICASFSRLLWNIVGRSERAPRGGRSGAPASERDPTNTTKKRSSASPPTQLTRRLGNKNKKTPNAHARAVREKCR